MNSKCFMRSGDSCRALESRYAKEYHQKDAERCPFFKTYDEQRAIEIKLEYRAAIKGFGYQFVTKGEF